MDIIQVAIVAADPLVRAGLASRFADEALVEIIGQLSPLEALALSDCPVDVVVWDVGWGVAEALPDLTELELPVLVLVADGEDAATALAAGARGVLTREAEVELLTGAIQAVGAGLLALAPAMLGDIWGHRPAPAHLSPAEALTSREQGVLNLVAEGLTNRAIAHRLSISEHTVKFHVNAIMTKLEAQSRTEAVVRATRLGLIAL